jgi:ribokinase
MAAAAQGPRVSRITVFGSLNVDLTCYVPHHPEPGETLTANRYVVRMGGKGANQAAACAKLSRDSKNHVNGVSTDYAAQDAEVRMVGAVGSDGHGQTMLDTLRKFGVNVDAVAVKEGYNTGVAVITVDENSHGENRIVLSPEANHSFSITDDLVDRVFSPRPDLIIMQLEIPLPVVLETLRRAKEAHVPVVFNPAPAQILPVEVYDGLGHLIVNETEATILTGIEVTKSSASIIDAAKWFHEKGARNVIITRGALGAYLHGVDAFGGPFQRFITVRRVPAHLVVDTTGAGDTFVGAYALGLLNRTSSPEQCVEDACYAGSAAVQKEGAMDSMPWREEYRAVLQDRDARANEPEQQE